MKVSRKETRSKERSLPELRFESQRLTSFSGLVILQALFEKLDMKGRLRRVFREADTGSYGLSLLFLLLVVQRMLGMRRLRDADAHRHDPLLRQVVGLKRLPDVSTMSRQLSEAGTNELDLAHEFIRAIVLESLELHPMKRLSVDFDGSVISTRRAAEGTAVGFNRKRKGARSYYPLLCTIAQSGQVFDVLSRPGNVHDSRGAADFMEDCLSALEQRFPGIRLESRADSAFFCERIVELYKRRKVSFSLSVPFERFAELKELIEKRVRWRKVDETTECFEIRWRPKCWGHRRVRLIAMRRRQPKQRKGPLQLDLFEPKDFEYQYSVIATNKVQRAPAVIAFHHGRGSQEGTIGELKSEMHFDYIPFRKRVANELHMLASVLGHNLLRRLQMEAPPERSNREWKRPACWLFEKASSLRMRLFHRAGRLTCPGNKKVLTISGDEQVAADYESILESLRPAA